MPPVIEHILARNKKSGSHNDGRRIALVLFSGLMKGVCGGGAMIALQDLGLSAAFDEIYTFSAGFPNACYLLSEDARRGTSIYYDDLSGSQFLNFLRFWRVADVEYVIHVMQKQKPIAVDKILNSNTKLYVRLKNKTKGEDEYMEVHEVGQNDFWSFMKAAISIPVLHPGLTFVRGQKYGDAARLDRSHIPMHIAHALRSTATDLLFIFNDAKQIPEDMLQSDRVYVISPSSLAKLSKFERRRNVLCRAAEEMEHHVKDIFSGRTACVG